MPFTVSHIAAVVPLHRPLSRLRLFSAAAIGSMVPDFGFLVPGNFERWQTHSLQALLSFCLPVGLIAFIVTQALIRPAVCEIAPDGAHARLVGSRPLSWTNPFYWIGVAAALLFGALTHLVWDGFTHENARGVRLFPQLLDYGPNMVGHALRLYRWLQYGSSVVGLVVVAAALALWLYHARAPAARGARRLAPGERWSWVGLYLAVFAGVMGWRLLRTLFAHGPVSLGGSLDRIGIESLRAAALSLVLVSAAIRLRLLFRPVPSASG